MAKMPRRYRRNGFARAGDAARALIRPALSKRGFGESRILTEWESVAGADLAGLCRPLRVSFAAREGYGGTLVLGVLGARALEAQHRTPQIIERVNAHYGYRAISRIRLEQLGPEAFATARRATSLPQPCPEVLAELADQVSPVRDEGLKTALEALGRNIAARKALRAADLQDRKERPE